MNKPLMILISAFALIGIGSTVALFSSKAFAQDASKAAIAKKSSLTQSDQGGQDDEDDNNGMLTAPVSMSQAASIATGRVPGFANQAILESDENKLIWDVEIVTREQKLFAVEVDANTGAILTVDDESDGDDEDGDGGIKK